MDHTNTGGPTIATSHHVAAAVLGCGSGFDRGFGHSLIDINRAQFALPETGSHA